MAGWLKNIKKKGTTGHDVSPGQTKQQKRINGCYCSALLVAGVWGVRVIIRDLLLAVI